MRVKFITEFVRKICATELHAGKGVNPRNCKLTRAAVRIAELALVFSQEEWIVLWVAEVWLGMPGLGMSQRH